jgi:hypothetical protein
MSVDGAGLGMARENLRHGLRVAGAERDDDGKVLGAWTRLRGGPRPPRPCRAIAL